MAGRLSLPTFQKRKAEYVTIHRNATTSTPFGQLQNFNFREAREEDTTLRISDSTEHITQSTKRVTGSATLWHADNPTEVASLFKLTQPTAGGWIGTEKFTLTSTYAEKDDYYVVAWTSEATTSAAVTSIVLLDDLTITEWGADYSGGQDVAYNFSFRAIAAEMSPKAGLGA
jgi:hypothetical protein